MPAAELVVLIRRSVMIETEREFSLPNIVFLLLIILKVTIVIFIVLFRIFAIGHCLVIVVKRVLIDLSARTARHLDRFGDVGLQIVLIFRLERHVWCGDRLGEPGSHR